MRRTLAVLALGGLMAAVVGSASALTVNGGVIQQGSDADLTCTASVSVGGYGLDQENGEVANIRFLPIDPACDNSDMLVNVTHTGGVQILRAELPLISNRIALTPPLLAKDITGLEVFIEGEDAPASTN